MDRKFYLNLASNGLRMPIGANLVLHQHDDPDAILADGERLGKVVVEAARPWRCFKIACRRTAVGGFARRPTPASAVTNPERKRGTRT